MCCPLVSRSRLWPARRPKWAHSSARPSGPSCEQTGSRADRRAFGRTGEKARTGGQTGAQEQCACARVTVCWADTWSSSSSSSSSCSCACTCTCTPLRGPFASAGRSLMKRTNLADVRKGAFVKLTNGRIRSIRVDIRGLQRSSGQRKARLFVRPAGRTLAWKSPNSSKTQTRSLHSSAYQRARHSNQAGDLLLIHMRTLSCRRLASKPVEFSASFQLLLL